MKATFDDRLMTLLTWGLMTLVALTPLPLASNRALPITLVTIAAGLLAALAMIGVLRKDKTRLRRLLVPVLPSLLFISVLVFIAIQGLVPVPFEQGHPLWREAANALPQADITAYLSIDPTATIEALPLLASYGLLFVVAHMAARRFDRLYLLTLAILVIGAGWLGLSFVDFSVNGEQRLLGDASAYPGVPTGTFVNRNSFATYAGMIATGGLVLVVWTLFSSSHTGYKQRSAIADALSERSLPVLFGLVLFVTGLSLVIMTESRAGFSATTLATIVILVMAAMLNSPPQSGGQSNRSKRSLWLMLMITIAAFGWLIILFQLSGDDLEARFSLLDDDLRWELFVHIRTMIEQRPWTGTGYNTFEAAYAMTRGMEQWLQPPRIDQAHSTYLELAVEIGIPATIALVLAPALLAWRALGTARKAGRAAMAPAIAVAWSILLGAHTAVDFSAEMPAIAVLYAVMLGMASGAARVLEKRRSA